MEQSRPPKRTLKVDDFYFSALADDEELFPISDEKYADELQLQEVLVSSSIAFSNRYGFPNKKRKVESLTTIKKELCSSSASSSRNVKVKSEPVFCKICMEVSPKSSMISNPNCTHVFCKACLNMYISAKIKESLSVIRCPEENCKGIIEPENCQDIIPKEVFERWGNALCEAMILAGKKYSYCPFKDCSALFLNDEEEDVGQSECPSCRRLFCAKCEVAWHAGMSCEEVKSLAANDREKEDFKMIEIAKNNKWKRCPKCKFIVEKTEGCLHITCRCQYQFCYGCGKKWSNTHHASCTVA